MVEEDEYRSTYNAVNQRRCVFEKAVLTRRCGCTCSTRFYLADREGIRCDSAAALERCSRFLDTVRSKARFALGLSSSDEPLPHAREIKVQNGGLLGLQQALRPELGQSSRVEDIAGLIRLAEDGCRTLDDLPYAEIIRAIVRFEGRARPRTRR